MPRQLADLIADFCRLIDDKGDPGDLFVIEAMRASYEAAEAEMFTGARPHDFNRTQQFCDRVAQRDAAKAEVLNDGEALATRLEAAKIDPLLLRQFLEYVKREEFGTAERICPRVEAFLKGTPARARAGGAAVPGQPARLKGQNVAKITPDDGGQRSNFCRAALANLKKRAEGHAKQHPTLRHMLVLPEGETLFVPARPGSHPLGGSSYPEPPAVSFGDSQVLVALPPAKCWPPGLKPIRAVVAEQANPPRPPARQRPYRVHLFFGDAAGMTPLQSLAADLVNLTGDVARAVFGARAPEDSTVFYCSPDYIHGKAAEILDAWLCTVHWWAWKAIDSPIHTRPLVVFDGSAIAADRRDQAVVEKMSFSALDCDIFTATAVTIDLFLRFLDLPPDLVWPADYPPVPKPQEPAPDAESTKPQASAEPRPTRADGKTAAPQGGAKLAEDGEPGGARETAPKVTWQEVQGLLLNLFQRGEQYTSLRELATRLKCAPGTVKKVLESNKALQSWSQPASHPKGQALNEVVTDRTASTREGNPADALPQADVDAIMKRLISDEKIKPEIRLKLGTMNSGQCRLLASWYNKLPDEAAPEEMVATYLSQQQDCRAEAAGKKGPKIRHRKV